MFTQTIHEETKNAIYTKTRKRVCGMNSTEICQKAILPPIRSLTLILGKEIDEIVSMMFNEFDRIVKD